MLGIYEVHKRSCRMSTTAELLSAVFVQDFVTLAETLVHNEKFRQNIKTKAKEYIDNNYDEAREREGFEKLATSMCKADEKQGDPKVSANDRCESSAEENAQSQLPEKEKSRDDTPAEEEKVENNVYVVTIFRIFKTHWRADVPRGYSFTHLVKKERVENNVDSAQSISKSKKALHFVGINVTSPKNETKQSPVEFLQLSLDSDSTTEEDKQPSEAEGGEDSDIDPVEQQQSSSKHWAELSTKVPVAGKMSARRVSKAELGQSLVKAKAVKQAKHADGTHLIEKKAKSFESRTGKDGKSRKRRGKAHAKKHASGNTVWWRKETTVKDFTQERLTERAQRHWQGSSKTTNWAHSGSTHCQWYSGPLKEDQEVTQDTDERPK